MDGLVRSAAAMISGGTLDILTRLCDLRRSNIAYDDA